MQADRLVERALCALLRGEVAAHLAYCSDDLLLEQVIAGQRQPPVRGKEAYVAFLASWPLFQHRRGYDILGPDTAAPQVFPRPSSRVNAPAQWTWVRASLWVETPLAGEDVTQPMLLQQMRLLIGVADDRIGMLELTGGDGQAWHSPAH